MYYFLVKLSYVNACAQTHQIVQSKVVCCSDLIQEELCHFQKSHLVMQICYENAKYCFNLSMQKKLETKLLSTK